MCTLTAAMGSALTGYRALSSIEDHQRSAVLEKYKEKEAQQKLLYDQRHKDDGVMASAASAMQNLGNLREDVASSGVTEDGTVSHLEQQEKESGRAQQQDAIDQSYQQIAEDHDDMMQDHVKEQRDEAHMWQAGTKGVEGVLSSKEKASGLSSSFYKKGQRGHNKTENDVSWASQMGRNYDHHMGIASNKGRSDMPYNHPYLNYAHQKYGGRKPPYSPVTASIYDDYTPTRYSKSGIRSDFDMPSF